MTPSTETEKNPDLHVPFVRYTCLTKNKEYRMLMVSGRITELTGFTQEEWCSTGNILFNIIHPEDRPAVVSTYNTLSPENPELSIQYRLIDKNGITWWIHNIATLTNIDSDGNIEIKGYLYDVSGKKKVTEIVKTLRAYQYALNESSIVSLTDTEGQIIYINENFILHSGYSRHELIGKTHQIVNSGYHPRDFFSTMWKTILAGKSWRAEVRNKAKDGTYFWVDTVITPVYNEQKEITQFLSIRNIISKQKEQEESIKQSEEKFRDIIENTSDMIQSTDGKGKLVFVNKSWCNRLGYTTDEVLGRPVLDFIAPECSGSCRQLFNSVSNGKETQGAEVIFLTKNGEKVFGEGTINTRFNEGALVLTRGIFRDISDSKKLMVTLQRQQKQLKEAQRLAQVGSWFLDKRLNLLEWSDQACRILEVKAGSVISYQLFRSAVHPEDLEKVEMALDNARNGQPYNLEHRLLINGKLKWIKSIIQIEFDQDRQPILYTGSIQDITEKKLSEIELYKKQNQLNEAQRTAKIGSYEWDTVNNTINGSDHFHVLLGLRKKKKYDFDTLFKNVHPDDQEIVMKTIQQSIHTEEAFSVQFRYITTDGLIRHFLAIRQTNYYQEYGKQLIGGTLQDITEAKNAEQKLFNSIIEAEENERKRIAADLHDGACQYLATAKLLIQSLNTKSASPVSEQEPLLQKIAETVNESMRLTRNVSQQLVPLILYDEGLIPAIQELVSTLNMVDCQRYQFTLEGKAIEIKPHFSINLYRIIQEFINNSQKYSNASSIKIKIRYSVSVLSIHLSDNGLGFDMEQVKKRKGIGLFNMTSRIRTIGGWYRFTSRPGKGVSLKLSIPVTELTTDV